MEMQRAMVDLSDTFVRALPDLTLVVRRDGLVLSNLGGRELGLPTQPGALRGKRLAEIWSATIATQLEKLMRRALKARSQVDTRFQRAGTVIEVRARPQGIDRVLLVMRAIGDHPPITDTSRREDSSNQPTSDCAEFARKFCEAIGNAQLRDTQLALAIVHLSELRALERTFGASVAERLGVYATERLCAAAGSSSASHRSTRIAQLETDQLAVLFDDIADEEAALIAAKGLGRALGRPIDLDGRQYSLNPWVGVALFPRDGREPEVLLDSAREAILSAQRGGTADEPVALPEVNTLPLGPRQDLEQELRWAVERDQFVLQYVPIVELDGRRTVSIEARLAWAHPLCGLVPAQQFIAVLDSLDVRESLDHWILRRANRDLAILTERGDTRVGLVLHLGRRTVESRSFVDQMAASLATMGISASRLTLCVGLKTLASGRHVRDQLHALRKQGLRIYLNDFGLDAIAPARIGSLPLDGVRLAPHCVDRLEQHSLDRAVCLSAVATARAFGLKSLAAGVATRAQVDFLIECGCNEATGPLFGAPQSLLDLPQEVRPLSF